MLRHLVRVAAPSALLVTLVACGDSPGTTSPDRSLPVIRVAAGGSATSARSAAGPAEMDSKGSARLIAASFDFVVDGELPELPDSAAAWVFRPSDAVADGATVRRLAEIFGVEGEVRKLPADHGGGRAVGPNDGSAPTLFFGSDPMLSWSFNAPWPAPVACGGSAGRPEPAPDERRDAATTVNVSVADPAPKDVERETKPGSTEPSMPCAAAPKPPIDVPDKDAARAAAIDLLTELGLDPDDYELEVYADDWSASVAAYPSIGGIRSPFAMSFGFAEQGKVQYASGILAEPEPVGSYPLVGVEAGLARLTEGYGGWATFGGRGTPVPANGDGATSSGAAYAPANDPAAESTAPAVDLPATSMPPLEKILVTIVDVELDLWTAWDADGTTWLLPAYRFIDDQGGWHTVPAVTDEYLQFEAPEVLIDADADPAASAVEPSAKPESTR